MHTGFYLQQNKENPNLFYLFQVSGYSTLLSFSIKYITSVFLVSIILYYLEILAIKVTTGVLI